MIGRSRGGWGWRLGGWTLLWGIAAGGGCGDPPESTAAATEPTTTAQTAGGATDSGTSTGAGSTEITESTTETGSGECVDDTDCPAGLLCVDGRCLFEAPDCGEVIVHHPIDAPAVMLVVGKPRSMVTVPWDHDGDPETPEVTRWSSVHAALTELVEAYDRSLELGVVLYPSKQATMAYSEQACVTAMTPEVPVAAMNGGSVLAALPPADAGTEAIAGAMATRAGMLAGLDHLKGLAAAPPRYLLLLSDGPANCALEAENDYQRFEVSDELLHSVVEEAFSLGIQTAVVGIDIVDASTPDIVDGVPDNVNPYTALGKLAVAGGLTSGESSLFFDASDQAALEASLAAIAARVIPCRVALNPIVTQTASEVPVSLRIAGVDYGTAQIGPKACAEGQSGWYFDDPEAPTEVTVCGQVCDAFQRDGWLDIYLQCPF